MRGKTNVTKNPMLRYILKRLVTMIPVLIGVTLITYGLMYISPSDPVEMLLQAQGIPVSEEVVEAMRVKAGLDQPFLIQYGTWLWNFIRGDMGVSLVNGTSIGLALQAALPKTLILTLSSMLVTVIISIPLGIYTAIRQNRSPCTLKDYGNDPNLTHAFSVFDPELPESWKVIEDIASFFNDYE